MSQNRQTHFKNLIQLGKTALKKNKNIESFIINQAMLPYTSQKTEATAQKYSLEQIWKF